MSFVEEVLLTSVPLGNCNKYKILFIFSRMTFVAMEDGARLLLHDTGAEILSPLLRLLLLQSPI